MTTPNTTPDPIHPDPKGPPPKGRAASAKDAAAQDELAAQKARIDAETAAQAAREAKAKADEAAFKAKKDADAAKAKRVDLERLAAATKHLRRASPDDPIALRRIECNNVVGDTLYGVPRNVIDLKNSAYAGVALLFDGQVVHVIHPDDASRSFWIGLGNVSAIYPRLEG